MKKLISLLLIAAVILTFFTVSAFGSDPGETPDDPNPGENPDDPNPGENPDDPRPTPTSGTLTLQNLGSGKPVMLYRIVELDLTVAVPCDQMVEIVGIPFGSYTVEELDPWSLSATGFRQTFSVSATAEESEPAPEDETVGEDGEAEAEETEAGEELPSAPAEEVPGSTAELKFTHDGEAAKRGSVWLQGFFLYR